MWNIHAHFSAHGPLQLPLLSVNLEFIVIAQPCSLFLLLCFAKFQLATPISGLVCLFISTWDAVNVEPYHCRNVAEPTS